MIGAVQTTVVNSEIPTAKHANATLLTTTATANKMTHAPFSLVAMGKLALSKVL
jgi:hypothetical protein